MTIRDALNEGAGLLAREETPFLDASVLLAHTLELSREKLLASYPDTITASCLETFRGLIRRRQSGVPVAYLTGEKEFFGRSFFVDRRVLIPRPDTEILVEAVLDLLSGNHGLPADRETSEPLRLLDVCTGTGCIPLTLALESEIPEIHAADISPDAEQVFLINRERLGNPPVTFHRSDLLLDIPGRWHIITSNPPYLTTGEGQEMEGRNWAEPSLALLGGEDGLDLVRRLVLESKDTLERNGYLILEAASVQMPAIADFMEKTGFREIKVFPDLAGRDRVIQGKLCGTQD